VGFAQMVDARPGFPEKELRLQFVRQEFLGEVRCLVWMYSRRASGRPVPGANLVEDREYNIVRFNGTYSPRSRYSYYLHFDSWRLNLQAGLWLPSYVFIEESNFQGVGPLLPGLHFKAQTRLWSYDPEPLKQNQEFADIQIGRGEGPDRTPPKEAGPVEAQRMWSGPRKTHALDHLQKVGLLAPPGDIDKFCKPWSNNLIVNQQS